MTIGIPKARLHPLVPKEGVRHTDVLKRYASGIVISTLIYFVLFYIILFNFTLLYSTLIDYILYHFSVLLYCFTYSSIFKQFSHLFHLDLFILFFTFYFFVFYYSWYFFWWHSNFFLYRFFYFIRIFISDFLFLILCSVITQDWKVLCFSLPVTQFVYSEAFYTNITLFQLLLVCPIF